MPLIGLTGGIATGKSTVGRLLEELGAVLFSADEVARSVTLPGSPIIREIEREIGRRYIESDGSLDRSALGALVFSDPDARHRLEAITHPAILAELKRRIAQATADRPDRLIVVEVPLLFEAGMESWFDAVVTVVASPEVQRARLTSRNGLTGEEATARIMSQMPLDEKAARSQFVLRNDGELTELEGAVARLVPRLLEVDKNLHVT